MIDIDDIYEACVRACELFGDLAWNVGLLWQMNMNPAVEVVTP